MDAPGNTGGSSFDSRTKCVPSRPSVPFASTAMNTNGVPNSLEIHRAAVGRQGTIGSTYNAFRDCFDGQSLLQSEIPESSLIIEEMRKEPMYQDQDSTTDSLIKKFQQLHLTGDLQLSILSDFVHPGGPGKLITSITAPSGMVPTATRTVLMRTKIERVEMGDFLKCISEKALQETDGTHIVIGIHWGAMCVVSIDWANPGDCNQMEIRDVLLSQLKKIEVGDYQTNVENGFSLLSLNNDFDMSISIYGDLLPQEQNLNLGNAPGRLNRLPKLIQATNDGKGVPIFYTLIPITSLRNVLKVTSMKDEVPVFYPTEEDVIFRCLELFAEVYKVKQKLNRFANLVQQHNFFVLVEDVRKIHSFRDNFDDEVHYLKSSLCEALLKVRSGKDTSILRNLYENADETLYSPKKVHTFLSKYAALFEKILFVKRLPKCVNFVGRNHSLTSALGISENAEVFVLFYKEDWAKSQQWEEHKDIFLTAIQKAREQEMEESPRASSSTGESNKPAFVFADCDVNPTLANIAETGTVKCISVGLFRNGKCVTPDIVAYSKQQSAPCVMKSMAKKVKDDKNASAVRKTLKLQCPGSYYGQCEKVEHDWYCSSCSCVVEYGFDRNFYCDCGRAEAQSFYYKCNNFQHGDTFLPYKNTKEDNLLLKLLNKIEPKKVVNILILGESGVGKSTYINGFTNYVTFPTLEDASSGSPKFLIPCSFSITDKITQEDKRIKMGEDSNEKGEVGEASTQQAKSYVFEFEDTIYRLIDTPGVGDPRGPKQDKKNFQNILNHISTFEDIHGICILLKPNESRLNVWFEFCISELLTHLDRDAAKNIVFVFTNARSTFYSPGDTMPILRGYIARLSGPTLALQIHQHNTFYMDNESVRFLAALQSKVSFNPHQIRTYSESWKISVDETNRLLNYILALPPHKTFRTISLNQARRLILCLTQPLAEITKLIQKNIAIVDDKRTQMDVSNASLEDIVASLHVELIDLEAVPLEFPRLVCGGPKCVKYVTVRGEQKPHYVQWCHDHCYLNDTGEEFPNPNVKQCEAMEVPMHDCKDEESDPNCRICGCNWKLHRYIRYENRELTQTIMNDKAQAEIKSKKDAMKAMEDFMDDLNKRIDGLNQEQKVISEVSSKIGNVLKTNAITPYNDALKQYLRYVIAEEEMKVNRGGDRRVLEGLKNMLDSYLEEVRILELQMPKNPEVVVAIEEVQTLIEKLYSLPITGKQIKQMTEVNQATQDKVNSHLEMKYKLPKAPCKKKGFSSYVPWSLQFWKPDATPPKKKDKVKCSDYNERHRQFGF